MAKLTGLFLRGGVYRLRVLIPLDLRPAHNDRTRIDQSLHGTDHRTATLRGTQERVKRFEEFSQKRLALQPQRLDTVTAKMASELAQRVRASVLRMDEATRDDPKAQAALHELHTLVTLEPLEALTTGSLTKPKTQSDPEPLSGPSADAASALASLNDIMSKKAGVQLAQRSLVAVLPLVKEDALQLGLTFDPQAPGAREALQGSTAGGSCSGVSHLCIPWGRLGFTGRRNHDMVRGTERMRSPIHGPSPSAGGTALPTKAIGRPSECPARAQISTRCT